MCSRRVKQGWTQICLSSHQLSESSTLTTTDLFSPQYWQKNLEELSHKTFMDDQRRSEMETELLQDIKVSPTWGFMHRCSQVMLTDSVLCKHGSTVPLGLRWHGYAYLSATNWHIMTRARLMMTIPVSSLAPLLYHSVPPRMPYFCLLTPISPVQRHFIGMKYTFFTILHITRETKSRASWISIVPSSSQRQNRITHLISRVIYHSLLLPLFLLLNAMRGDSRDFLLFQLLLLPKAWNTCYIRYISPIIHDNYRSNELQKPENGALEKSL